MSEPAASPGQAAALAVSAAEPLLLYQVLIEEYQSQAAVGAGPPTSGVRAGPPTSGGLPPPIPQAQLDAWKAQRRELERAPAASREVIDSQLTAELYRWLHENKVGRSALCFSGGGIRSATFGLGVLQGLARLKLVSQFDFLSTVSGGGYLGGWLTAWIHREHQKRRSAGAAGAAGAAEAPEAAVQAVEAQLGSSSSSPLSPEPEPVRHLRSYSRYMSPKLGFLSADTWALVGIYLRNITLNWLVLLPLIAAALMFPRISTVILRLPESQAWSQAEADHWQQVLLWGAIVCGLIAFAYMALNRPGIADRCRGPFAKPPALPQPRQDARPRGPDLRSQGWVLALGMLPLWLLTLGVTIYWGWVTYGAVDKLSFEILGREASPAVAFTVFGAGLGAGGFALSRIFVRFSHWKDAGKDALEALVITLAGALGGFLAYALAIHGFPDLGDILDVESYVCFAAPLVLFVFLTAATLFVGLASRVTGDEDREWLARAGAWILIVICMRGLLSAVVVFGPVALAMSRTMQVSLGSLGGISGLITIFVGRSEKTPGKQEGAPESGGIGGIGAIGGIGGIVRKVALALALPVFCLTLLALLSLGTSLLMKWLQSDFLPEGPDWNVVATTALSQGSLGMLNIVYNAPWRLVLLVLALFLGIGGTMGLFVNINKFSLHAAYRDRLIRAYLGASRPRAERRPNSFTGFDERDNVQMCDLEHPRPLHLLNLALNLVGGKDLAWQDRKAAPFSVSRLHAGSRCVGYRSSRRYGYGRSLDQSITLGTAVAISGAAASPNMGYHSSPLVTFLLTLFNVRLGWWLGNPGAAGRRTFNKSGPNFAPRPLLAEAFGRTNDDNPWVYLSDGGHFENLGLYEMVLRRCRFIVVSDGSQDPELSFEDLGNAVSKIRIDLGVPILFEKLMMKPRDAGDGGSYNLEVGSGAPYCAIGSVCYSCVDRRSDGGSVEDGVLLYIKSSLNGTEPVDVFHYAKAHPAFPHEPTENQLYTEAQFESYRALGSHVVAWIADQVAKLPEEPSIEQFFNVLREAVGKAGFGKPPKCESRPAVEVTAG
jgi:hypothetical protein